MYTQLLNFIIQPLLGGAAGYITNEYAINMLFKSYTPLKIGGVIPKTREEFIANITRLIEEDIVNKDKLAEILCDTKLINNFHKLSDDFYNKYLYSSFESKTLEQLPGFEETAYQIKKQLTAASPQFISMFSNYICNSTGFKTSIIEKILPEAIDNTFTQLVCQFNDADTQNSLITSIADSDAIKLKPVNHIVDDITVDKIISSIINNAVELIKSDEKINSSLDNMLGSAINHTRLAEGILATVTGIISDNSENITLLLSKLRDKALNDEGLNTLINDMSKLLLDFGESLDIPLIDILSDKSLSGLRVVINSLLPQISQSLLELIMPDEKAIKELIHQSVDETIDEQDTNKKLMLSMAKGTVHKKIDEFDIKKIISELADDKDKANSLSLKAVVYIKKYLSDTTISQIIKRLKTNGILNHEKFADFLHTQLKGLDLSRLTKLLDISNSLTKITDSIYIRDIVKKQIISFIKNRFILSDNTVKALNNAMQEKAHELTSKSLSSALYLAKNIRLSKDNIDMLKSICFDSLAELDFYRIITDKAQNIEDSINSYCNDFIAKYKSTELNTLLDKLNTVDELHSGTAEAVRQYLLSNLAPALNKFIHGLSSANLEKLSDEELCEMAKSFIGNNLKPIMYFGGLLGIIAGLLLAVFNGNASVLAPVSLSSTLTYAGVGFLTNAIAINMLFRPYKEKRLLKNIPFFRHFSLGYIAKNKGQMADSFAYALDKYLLSDTSINELFDKYETGIKNSLIVNLEEHGSEMASEYMQRNKNNISSYIYSKISTGILNNKTQISSYATDKISDISLTRLFTDNTDTIVNRLYDHRESIKAALYDNINKITRSNKKLSDISYIDIQTIVSNIIDRYADELFGKFTDMQDGLSNSNADSLSKKIADYVIDFIENSKDKSISLLLSRITTDRAKENIGDSMEGASSDGIKNMISGLINKAIVNSYNNPQIKQSLLIAINSELDKATKIDALLGGSIGQSVQGFIDRFLSDIQPESHKLLTRLKPYASTYVQEQIVNGLNFLTKGLYNMAGGAQIIDSAVDKFMTKKLPVYLAGRQNELSRTFNEISSAVMDTELHSLGLSIDRAFELKPTEAYTSTFTELGRLVASYASDRLNEYADEITLSDLLSMLGYNDISSVTEIIANSTKAIADKAMNSIEENKEIIIGEAKDSARELVRELCSLLSLNNIFSCITDDDVQTICSQIIDTVADKEFLADCLKSIGAILDKSDCRLYLKDICRIDEIGNIINSTIDCVVKDNGFNELCTSQLELLLEKVGEDDFSKISPDAKSYLFTSITDAALQALRGNATRILNDIGFDTLIREQLLAMSNKKIHKMFNSFAGKYFRTLMIYGVFGAIFGINTIAGLVIAASYGIKGLVDKKHNKDKDK